MKIGEVVDRIRGPEGTPVEVKVRQPNAKEARTLKMIRGTLFRPTITGLRKQSSGDWDFAVDGLDRVGYLRIQEITASTPHELRKLAQQLEGQGLRGLILDLRGLFGAGLHPTVLLADSLLDHGMIGRVRMADRVMNYEATPDAVFRGWPIVVLVDRGTTCGAEWLAAALQDNHRAMIVGTPTASAFSGSSGFGATRGTADVSSTVPLGDGSWSLMLTTGRLERGDGRPLAAPRVLLNAMMMNRAIRQTSDRDVKWGVKPDHLIGDGPRGPGSQDPPQRRGVFEDRETRVDPRMDQFMIMSVQLLHDALSVRKS
jgi:carboxyl-terminal processing protease